MDEKLKSIEEFDDKQNTMDSNIDCPTLKSVLNYASDANVQIIYQKNLDNLQEELEHLFVHLNRQHNELSQELPLLENTNNCTNEGSVITPKVEEPVALPIKTEMPENNALADGSKKIYSSRVRCKPAKTQDLEFSLKNEIPKQQKNDAPNRFWSLLDPYFCDISTDDIKVLENWIESHKQDSEYQDIPPLGTHYSSTWTKSDILEEIKEGSKSVENPKGIDMNALENTSGTELIQKAEEENSCQFNGNPPLIQNLISSLVQENIIASSDIMAENIPDIDVVGSVNETNHSNKELEETLENCLVTDLEELGVLMKTDRTQDDELLQELKQMQALLIPVSNYNLQKKKELLARAKHEIEKQESKKRLKEVDAKVMESYRAMAAARSKGKKMVKNELYIIRTMLEEREDLTKS